MPCEIDAEYVRRTLTQLVRIDSQNPVLVPGAAGEREICEWIAGELMSVGATAGIREPERGRTSAIGVLKGTGGGRSLMFNGHVDTVAVAGMAEPFAARTVDGKLYGRGAYDMKCGIAAALGAMEALARSGVELHGDLVLAAAGDEEYGSLGTRDLLTVLRTDAAIVMEPTGLDVCLAHKGYVWVEVEVTGRAAHGSRFELGVDANMKMGKFLARLEGLERELRARARHALVGPPSLHAAVLAGGSGLSTYAASSKVQIERRTVPGESEAQVVAEIEAVARAVAADDADFHATVRSYFVRDPFEVSPGAGIVAAVERATTDVRGCAPRRIGDTPWMDAALCYAAGIETVVFGACGAGAHADVEWVDVASVVALADVLACVAVDYCNRPRT